MNNISTEISEDKANIIIDLITNDVEQLDILYNRFSSEFKNELEIQILYKFSLFLMEGLLDNIQQVVTIWFLYKKISYYINKNKSDPENKVNNLKQTPFYDVFTYLSNSEKHGAYKLHQKSRSLINNFLAGRSIIDFGKYSATQILLTNIDLELISEPDDLVRYHEKMSSLIISNPDSPSSKLTQPQLIKNLLLDSLLLTQDVTPFVRELPDLYEHSVDELMFGSYDCLVNLPFLYDNDDNLNSTEVAKLLANESLNSKLSDQQNRIIDNISMDKFTDLHNIDDAKFQALKEKNPNIAAKLEIYRKRNDINYLKKVVQLPINDYSFLLVEYAILLKADSNLMSSFLNKLYKEMKSSKDKELVHEYSELLKKLVRNLKSKHYEFNDNEIVTILSILPIITDKKLKDEISNLIGD